MAKTLLTGGSGFLGSHIAHALVERGDELRVLARRSSDLSPLEGLEFERANGDICDRRAVRRAVEGVNRVFHVAGRTSMRAEDHDSVFATNVRGARTVFEEARAAEVERLVHTSTVGAIGVAKRGATADETTPFEIGHLGIAYVNSKHEAELEAFHEAARGLPVVVVNPTFVLGPDAARASSMGLIRRFLLGKIPVYLDGALNIVDVRDIAAGHLLADEKGAVGERYILGGRNFTLDRLFADLSRISGVAPPPLKLPARLAVAGVGVAEQVGVGLPIIPEEVRAASLWWTYRNTKAKRELGFAPRPHEETLEDAVAWQLAQFEGPPPAESPAARALRTAGKVVGGAARLVGR